MRHNGECDCGWDGNKFNPHHHTCRGWAVKTKVAKEVNNLQLFPEVPQFSRGAGPDPELNGQTYIDNAYERGFRDGVRVFERNDDGRRNGLESEGIKVSQNLAKNALLELRRIHAIISELDQDIALYLEEE